MCILLWLRLSQILPALLPRRIRRRPRKHGPDDWEDPEALLDWAMLRMNEMHARNLERMVQAITQKNNLQQMVNDTQKRVNSLQAKADAAQARGNHDTARQIRRECEQYIATLEMTRQSLAQAIEAVDESKAAIKREEARVRRKSAEALALKAEWRCALLTYQVEQARVAMEAASPGQRSPVEGYARLRARFVKAVIARNSLRQMVDDAEKRIAKLEAKAELAAGRGDVETAAQLRREKEHYAATLPGFQESAARAEQIVSEAAAQVKDYYERLYQEFPDVDTRLAQARQTLRPRQPRGGKRN